MNNKYGFFSNDEFIITTPPTFRATGIIIFIPIHLFLSFHRRE